MIRAFKKELLLPNGDITMYADILLFLISMNYLVRNDVALEICSQFPNFQNSGIPSQWGVTITATCWKIGNFEESLNELNDEV